MTGSGFSFDREKIHLNVARIKKGGENFEVVIDPDKALDLKAGKNISVHEVLKDELVFNEARKGLRASEHRLKEVFGTVDPLEIARMIITKGEVQETAEHRAKLMDEKRRKIINMIHMYGVDPKTHLPHPVERIERALDEAKVKIDPRKTADDQIDEILKKLRQIIPLKLETKQIEVRIPSQYGAKSFQTLKSSGRILKEEWLTDGSLLAVVELPAGLEPDFYERINAVTHGHVEAKVIASK